VVAILESASVQTMLEAVDLALARGATVIALTPSHSPLTKRATLTIAIDHPEDTATQIPMISRILHLAMIDVLAVGVAMSAVADQAPAPARRGAGATARENSPDLARLTSHSR
jgi:glucokinase